MHPDRIVVEDWAVSTVPFCLRAKGGITETVIKHPVTLPWKIGTSVP